MANKTELQAQYEEIIGEKPDSSLTGKQLVDKIKEAKKKAKKAGKEKPAKKQSSESASDNKDIIAQMNELTSAVNKIAGAIVSVSGRLENLEKGSSNSTTTENTSESGDEDSELDEGGNQSVPVPSGFRKAVDEILSPDFGIDIQEIEDSIDFTFTIIVPKRFSSLSKGDIEKSKQDLRSKRIPHAKGINGVKEWCKLVRQNLNRFYIKEGVASPFTKKSSE